MILRGSDCGIMRFICLFFPAVLTIKEKDLKEPKTYIIKKYICYNLLVNTVILCILDLKNNFIPLSLGDVERFNVHFSLQYLILAIVLSLVLPKILYVIKNNINISFKRKK